MGEIMDSRILFKDLTLPKPKHSISVPEFYAGKEILVTGGSGFIGKVLLEKILRSCPDVKTIYVMLRPRKGVPYHARFEELVKSPVFNYLRTKDPSCLEKMVGVEGDLSVSGMSLSREGRQQLSNCSIVLHAAATVRFDQPLKDAVFENLRATRDMLDLALEMKNLKVFTYVSTSYSNCYLKKVEERMYTTETDWREIIHIAETADAHTLATLTSKLIGDHPNTYTYTKFLAENAVNDYRTKLPVFICRPSIVSGCISEPIPGWVDSMNGPIAACLGVTSGVVRVLYMDTKTNTDYIACDIVVKGLVVGTWYRGCIETDECIVVNACNNSRFTCPPGALADMAGLVNNYPPRFTLWYPFVTFATFRPWYLLLVFLLHIVPGTIVEILLKIKGIQFSVLRLYRKIFTASDALYYFTTRDWIFDNDKFNAIPELLPPEDRVSFEYDIRNIDLTEAITNAYICANKYIFGDPPTEKDEEIGRKRVKILFWIDRVVRTCLFLLVAWIFKRLFFSRIISVYNFLV